jgi:hypothetical protein
MNNVDPLSFISSKGFVLDDMSTREQRTRRKSNCGSDIVIEADLAWTVNIPKQERGTVTL